MKEDWKILSKHHNLAKDNEVWANHPENYTYLERELHRRLHLLFSTMPPHMQVQYLLKIGGKCLTDSTKEQVLEILRPEDEVSLYKPKTIRNIENFKQACHRYLRIDYIK